MAIRQMTFEDIERVSELCLASFMGSVASTLSGEGIATFTDVASIQSFTKRMLENNTSFVYEQVTEDNKQSDNQDISAMTQVMGVLELKENKHISMLFVCPSVQRKGFGRALIAAACQHAWQDQTDSLQDNSPQGNSPQGNSLQGNRAPQCEPLTVSASLTSVPAYERYGFKVAGGDC